MSWNCEYCSTSNKNSSRKCFVCGRTKTKKRKKDDFRKKKLNLGKKMKVFFSKVFKRKKLSYRLKKILITIISLIIVIGLATHFIVVNFNPISVWVIDKLSYLKFEEKSVYENQNNNIEKESVSEVVSYIEDDPMILYKEYLGEWNGYFNNPSGVMDLCIDIYLIEEDSEGYLVTACFKYGPRKSAGNTKGDSGVYKMKGYLNPDTGHIWMDAKEWIEGPIGNNPMPLRDISGDIDIESNEFNGDLKRKNNKEFFLSK